VFELSLADAMQAEKLGYQQLHEDVKVATCRY
jgi:hypothetical protein